MECPYCGYVLSPFDKQCPRCYGTGQRRYSSTDLRDRTQNAESQIQPSEITNDEIHPYSHSMPSSSLWWSIPLTILILVLITVGTNIVMFKPGNTPVNGIATNAEIDSIIRFSTILIGSAVVAILDAIAFYVILCFRVSNYFVAKGRPRWIGMLISLLIGPLIGLIVGVMMPENVQK